MSFLSRRISLLFSVARDGICGDEFPIVDFPRARLVARPFQTSASDALARLVADGEFVASFFAARRQNLSSVFRRHALSEPVFIASFAV